VVEGRGPSTSTQYFPSHNFPMALEITQLQNPQKNYGFVIDNRKCIGCHACSVACKSENEVPLSVSRTWVKYVETGHYPDTRRHFQVTRCNHCANPPCTRICPTEAMYQRADGIVEFDNDFCIGCKACMQACPYDAIHIDPDNGTAAKCHYCGHRTDIGLDPACVVVCPEHAIIAGDMNDPTSEISGLLANHSVTVRKPEQGTAPKLFYIEGNDVVMHPTAVERTPASYMWADSIPLDIPINNSNSHSSGDYQMDQPIKVSHSNGTEIRSAQPQGQNYDGPIAFGQGTMAEHMVQVAYNQQHLIPWHWPVPAYLVTKGIGSGIFMLLTFYAGLVASTGSVSMRTQSILGFTSLLFIALTTGLLVFDLERPERFLYILMRPQWRSWLTRGAVILIGFTLLGGLWWLGATGAAVGWWNFAPLLSLPLMWISAGFALMAAIYTAFLFAQAEGRDLWQSPLLPFHLVVQAIMVGSGMILLLNAIIGFEAGFVRFSLLAFIGSIIVDAFVTLAGEFGIPHASEVAAAAAHMISHGKYRNHFWLYSLVIGHAVALLLALADLVGGFTIFGAVGAVCAIFGLYMFEYAFVMAPQEIPNS
jgi:Fe-S-cluster-containing dehydrogenase component/formate-dependent nitrite reductase membrane component NrfD